MSGAADVANILAGRRVLLVEDEFLVAMDVESMLERAGCASIGPAIRLEQALTLACGEAIDAAVLDVNLNGTPVFPVAKALSERGIPFLFTTGYDGASIPPAFQAVLRLQKPFNEDDLIHGLKAVMNGREP
jgi:two-component system, chemotaxis family, sensor kinase Cph1